MKIQFRFLFLFFGFFVFLFGFCSQLIGQFFSVFWLKCAAIYLLAVFSRFRRVGNFSSVKVKTKKAKVQNIVKCKGQALTSRSSRRRYAPRLNSSVINAYIRVILDMFMVIFRAEIAELDDEYLSLAPKLRNEAIQNFGCFEFFSVSESGYEVAISYWNSQEDIAKWREHNLHKYAQDMGYKKWYSTVRVEIANIVRSYSR